MFDRDWLRRKHQERLEKLAAARGRHRGRIAAYVNPDRSTGALIELHCQSTRAAGNEWFIAMADAVARKVAEGSHDEPDPDAVRRDPSLAAMFEETAGVLRETVHVVRCRRLEGAFVASYVHHDGRTGVLLVLDAVPAESTVAADLCMHAAFAHSRPSGDKPLMDQFHVRSDVYGAKTVRDVLAGAGVSEIVGLSFMTVEACGTGL